MAILGDWVSITGVQRTTPGFVHELAVKAAAHGGVDRVEFAVAANGSPHSTLTASAPLIRKPNFSDQPSRMPGVALGMAEFPGYGVGLNLSTVPAGTIVVTATIVEVGGASYTLPTTITVYNDTDGTDRRPRAVTIYADGDSGNDANNGSSWAQAVRSLGKARDLARSGAELGGARILCRGRFTNLSAGVFPSVQTAGDWWCEMVADAAGAFLDPPDMIGQRYLSAGVGGTDESTVICKNRFVGFRLGPHTMVTYSWGGVVWNWFDGCWSEATNYVAGRLSVLYADPTIGAVGDFCGWDGATVGQRFYTGCSIRGFSEGYKQHRFLFDCEAVDIIGIACKIAGAQASLTGAFRMQSQRYAAREVHGFVRMDSDATMGKGRPACTVTIPVAGTARITGPVGGYDFSQDADDLVGASYWGLRFEGSGATNLDTGVGLLVTNRGNDGGAPWVEVEAPGAVAGSWPADTCSFYTARTVAPGLNYWNIHPDGVQIESDRVRDVMFDCYLVDCPNSQSYFTSSIDSYDLDLCLFDNLRDDGSGLTQMPWSGSDVTNSILQRWTITGQWSASGSASGWAGTLVQNCVFGSLGGSASTIESRGATVRNCHVISGAPFGTNGTSGPWFAGDPSTSPWPYEPSSGNKGTGNAAVVDPPEWAYSTSGSTRGVLRNIGDRDWSLPTGGSGITATVATTLSIDVAAAATTAGPSGGGGISAAVNTVLDIAVAAAAVTSPGSGGGGPILATVSTTLSLDVAAVATTSGEAGGGEGGGAVDATGLVARAAAGPSEVQGDSGRVKSQPLPDLIAHENHQAARKAARRRGFGLFFRRGIPPGAT